MEELIGLAYLKKNEIKNKTCDESRPYAFISYSHDPHDSQIVMNVFNHLYNKGYNLWIDTANMPHDENAWTTSALKALLNQNCTFAFFFRSESSMIKDTIAKELEKIKDLDHIKSIVTVDIWHTAGNTAKQCAKAILNSHIFEHVATSDKICSIVDTENSAIRLAADAQNNILNLAEAMEYELKHRGVVPQAPPPPPPPPPPPSEYERISLPDFLAKYKTEAFDKDTFQTVRLVGEGKYAKYTTNFYASVYDVTWNFIMKLLEEQGEAYIRFVNEKNPDSKKNPIFITAEEHQRRKEEKNPIAYRQLELPGLEGYSMCRNYALFNWVRDVLRRRMQELNMPLESFSFEYKATSGIKPITLTGESKKKPKSYNLTLYGQSYTNLNLKQTMLTVFHQILDRHPEKLDQMLQKLPCLAENQPIHRDAHPTIFRQGDYHTVNGRTISIGASLGYNAVLSYIERVMLLCGEPKDAYTIVQLT